MTRLTSCCWVKTRTQMMILAVRPPPDTTHSHLRSLLLLEEELLGWPPVWPVLLSLHWAQSPVMMLVAVTQWCWGDHCMAQGSAGWKVTESAGMVSGYSRISLSHSLHLPASHTHDNQSIMLKQLWYFIMYLQYCKCDCKDFYVAKNIK